MHSRLFLVAVLWLFVEKNRKERTGILHLQSNLF